MTKILLVITLFLSFSLTAEIVSADHVQGNFECTNKYPTEFSSYKSIIMLADKYLDESEMFLFDGRTWLKGNFETKENNSLIFSEMRFYAFVRISSAKVISSTIYLETGAKLILLEMGCQKI